MDGPGNQGKQSVNLVLTVLEIVAPVFLIAGLGVAWVRLGYEYRMQFVTRLAASVAMPCLIFTTLMQTEVAPAALAAVAAAAFAGYLTLGVLFYGLVRVARLEVRTYLAPLIFGNTGNLSLPLGFFSLEIRGLALPSRFSQSPPSVPSQQASGSSRAAVRSGSCFANRWSTEPCSAPCSSGRAGRRRDS